MPWPRSWTPFKILYYEDPLPPQSFEALEYVAQNINIPIATGERCYNIFQFKDLIDRKVVSSDSAGSCRWRVDSRR